MGELHASLEERRSVRHNARSIDTCHIQLISTQGVVTRLELFVHLFELLVILGEVLRVLLDLH
jgi:hypothetical protein